MLIDGDGKKAADCVGIHGSHYVHGAALTPQFDHLGESGRIYFLVVKQLASEVDDGCVLFIQANERTVEANHIDHLGVDAGLETTGLVSIPLKIVIGGAASDQNGEFARVRIERSARNRRVVEVQ